MLKHALLGLLTYAPMTGYDLKQIMVQSTSNFWYAKQSQIYTTLKAMEEDELVESVIEEQKGKPDRRVYSLQEKGKRALKVWLGESITELELRKESVLLKLFFSAPKGKRELLENLEHLQKLHQTQLGVYQNETKAVIEDYARILPEAAKDELLWDATRRFGVLFEEMYIAWIEETKMRIEKEFEDES